MRFFRLLFSRFTLVLLAIMLQIAMFVVIVAYFSAYFAKINLVLNILTVLVLLLIINRDMGCDAKLPWSILVTVIPLVGMVLYFCFSHNYASRSERKMFAKLPQINLADQLPEAPPKYRGQLEYLRNMGAPCFSETATKYFPSGEEFLDDFLAELEKAEKFVFLEYFVVEHGKMLDSILEVLKRRIAEGVEVRLLYDDIGSMTHVKHSFFKEMREYGINCVRFGSLRPVVSAVYNNRDHRKISVIDGKVGYISGFNLADEYINHTHPFGYWKDTGVKLQGAAVSSLTTMFLQMFDMSAKKVEEFEPYLNVQTKSLQNTGTVAPFGDGPRPLYHEQIAKNVYLNLINQAEYDLYITTPYLIVDDAFIEALKRAALRGVDVNVVIPAVPDKKSVYAMTKQSCYKLIHAGVKIFKFREGFIHAKSFVADGIAGVIGTINLDYRSLVHHYECGVYMYDTSAAREMYYDLKTVVETRCDRQENPFKLNPLERLVCIFANLFRPLM